jgi:hypothetical protein
MTNWRRYQSTQATRNKLGIFNDKIYIVYNGMNGQNSVGLYSSWHLTSQHVLGSVAVHGTVKKHETQKAWKQIANIYPGVTSQTLLEA